MIIRLNVAAKDARIQVSFNPDRVRRYRLIGYENRDIEDKRFRDDTIDAGEAMFPAISYPSGNFVWQSRR